MVSLATRRSPRTISKLTSSLLPNTTFTPQQSATLLALCQLTGWSADRISLKVTEKLSQTLTAEQIFTFYNNWVDMRPQKGEISVDEHETMLVLLSEIGVGIYKKAKRLDQTSWPVSVQFAKRWSPKV
jgi:hypothetical protein